MISEVYIMEKLSINNNNNNRRYQSRRFDGITIIRIVVLVFIVTVSTYFVNSYTCNQPHHNHSTRPSHYLPINGTHGLMNNDDSLHNKGAIGDYNTTVSLERRADENNSTTNGLFPLTSSSTFIFTPSSSSSFTFQQSRSSPQTTSTSSFVATTLSFQQETSQTSIPDTTTDFSFSSFSEAPTTSTTSSTSEFSSTPQETSNTVTSTSSTSTSSSSSPTSSPATTSASQHVTTFSSVDNGKTIVVTRTSVISSLPTASNSNNNKNNDNGGGLSHTNRIVVGVVVGVGGSILIGLLAVLFYLRKRNNRDYEGGWTFWRKNEKLGSDEFFNGELGVRDRNINQGSNF